MSGYTVEVDSGACGLSTKIFASSDDMQYAKISITSECTCVNSMACELDVLDSFMECFVKICDGQVYKIAKKHLKHAACPVPFAIIKAVEAACGLTRPGSFTITIKEEV